MAFQRTLRFRIVVASALLSALIVVVVSIYVLRDARERAIGILEARATEQAALIASAMAAHEPGRPVAGASSDASGARVTILDIGGDVIEDSHSGAGQPGRSIGGPEMTALLAAGQSLRRGSDPVLGGDAVIAARVVQSAGGAAAVVRVALPISEADDSLNGLRATAAIGGIAVVALATVFATFLSGRLTGSIATVTEGARRVAAGDLEHRLRPEPPLEVEHLATAVNEMAARLSHLIELEAQERGRIESILATMSDGVIVVDAGSAVQLANPAARTMLRTPRTAEPGQRLYSFNSNYDLNQLVIQAVETRETTQGEVRLLESRRTLRVLAIPLPEEHDGESAGRALVLLTDLTERDRIERTRREFVSNASHELRTPLTAIRASVETLADRAIEDPAAAREFLDRISADVARMDALIAEMLELSRLEAGEGDLSIEDLDPAALLRQATDLMTPMATTAGVTIAANSASLPAFPADRRRVIEALTNLVSNAIKASPRGAEVRISASADENSIAFRVEDDGPGIDPRHIPHIFERFYKGDPSRSDGGAGLGLAIVKHIASAHNGDVTVDTAPGEGAAFTLAFPRTTATDTARPAS